ncbi:hypothetical protein VTK73DRAFT_8919 [Phialemonium thermophilum]|uniref:Peptidase S53 activation domain-containing protein n=1 Tax=Phialemonium thermophilum TaxID=223376 RepID=A0ABR3W5P2_9PEZI
MRTPILLSVLATLASARVFDSLHAVPKGWRELRAARSDDAIALKIALRQSRPAALEQAVLEISTPGHPNYGMHMTRDELRAYTAPSESAVADVTAWVRRHGARYSVDNDWISVSTDVGTANQLLNTTFSWYEYEGGGGPKLRTLAYSVPDEVADHVDLVQPTTRFGQLGSQKSTIFEMTIVDESVPAQLHAHVDLSGAADAVDVACTGVVTPDCLKSLYHINYTASADGNLVAFASYLEQYARYADLQTFETNYVPQAKGQNFSVTLINGGKNDQNSAEGQR